MMRAFEVEQQGCRLNATVSGSGPPVVFIQGVGLHGDGWLPQVASLGRAYTCMRFDNRGIGRSVPLGSALSVERMAEDVRALMDAVGWDDAHVVGHSLGALVALEVALSSPRRVRSLALLCASAAGRDLVRLSWWSLWVGLRMKVGPRPRRRRAFLEMVMPAASLIDADLEGVAAALAPLFGYDLADQPPIALRQAAAARAYSAAQRLDALPSVPTMVMTGAEDRVARPEHGVMLARRIRHARHVELPGAAHGLTIHRAEEVNDLLGKHLTAAEEDRGRPSAANGA
jgi:pimeloyl-ACP methyl ester carboxylesterase